MKNYRLRRHKVIECNDILEWGMWFEQADRRIALDKQKGIEVSTVFLGIDHNFSGKGKPLLFETMVFGGKYNENCGRYSTWEEAEMGHKRMCRKVFEGR